MRDYVSKRSRWTSNPVHPPRTGRFPGPFAPSGGLQRLLWALRVGLLMAPSTMLAAAPESGASGPLPSPIPPSASSAAGENELHEGGWVARGASRSSGTAELRGPRLHLEFRGLAPGSYQVLLGSRCPVEPKLETLATGRVDPKQRSGDTPRRLPVAHHRVGRILVSDRKNNEYELQITPARRRWESRLVVMLREDGSARPSLSDAYGLVGCARLLPKAGAEPIRVDPGE